MKLQKEDNQKASSLLDVSPEFAAAKNYGLDFEAINRRFLKAQFVPEPDNPNGGTEISAALFNLLPVMARLVMLGKGNHIRSIIGTLCSPYKANEATINYIFTGKAIKDTAAEQQIQNPMRAITDEEIAAAEQAAQIERGKKLKAAYEMK